MNALTASTSLCPLTSIEYLTFFSPFFPLFLFSFSFSLCPVSVTGAVEGSQSVKEAQRGLMRTVSAKRVSNLGLCFCSISVCMCVYV